MLQSRMLMLQNTNRMALSSNFKLGRSFPKNLFASQRTFSTSVPADIMLYQYEVCPFCCGLKAFMDFHRISYKTIEVNPLNKKELKQSQIVTDKNYKKVPIAIIDGKQVNDSREILQYLCDNILKNTTISQEDKNLMTEIYNDIVILLPMNIYRTMEESYEAFQYVAQYKGWSWATRMSVMYTGSVFMRLISPRLARKYNVEGDVREVLKNRLDTMLQKFDHNVVDTPQIVLYGMCSAMEGMTTLRDLQASNPKFDQWYKRVKSAVGDSLRI